MFNNHKSLQMIWVILSFLWNNVKQLFRNIKYQKKKTM